MLENEPVLLALLALPRPAPAGAPGMPLLLPASSKRDSCCSELVRGMK